MANRVIIVGSDIDVPIAKQPEYVSTRRRLVPGQAVPWPCVLYWIGCSPDSPGAGWEITDSLIILGNIVYDHFDPDKHSEQLIFDPPIRFTVGIFIEKFDHMHSLTFGYV